jgi:hypothetical protein
MRSVRVFLATGLLVGVLSIGSAHTANAAIHELVAKFCGNGNLDPGGQVRFGTQSFLRALQATGMYTINFGSTPPAGSTIIPPDGVAPGTVPVTVEVDFSNPASKFSDIGDVYFRFVDTELGFTVFVRIGALDHAAFEQCKNLNP